MAEPKSNVVSFEQHTMSRKEPIPEADYTPSRTQSTGVSRQQDFIEDFKKDAQGIIQSLEDSVQRIQPENIGVIRINLLPNKKLNIPIEAVVERDGESFLARTLEIPLYGYGEDFIEAINVLKYEIESIYDDLMEDDNFTEEWLRIKEYLKARIVDR